MINTGSYHVYAEEVEEAIASIPGIRAVRVTGEPDPIWGQAVTAQIVAESVGDPNALIRRIHEELRKKLAKYKIPKAIKLVDHL